MKLMDNKKALATLKHKVSTLLFHTTKNLHGLELGRF